MKKFFTLIAAALVAVNVFADEKELWTGSVKSINWDGKYLMSDAGAELKNAGAQAGDELRFYVTVPADSADTWQIKLLEGHWGPTYAYYCSPKLTGNDGTPYDLTSTNYLPLKLTQEMLDSAYKQKYWGGSFLIQSNYATCTKIALKTALDWSATPKAITFGDDGFIAASEFEGLNDDAKIAFTYHVAGNPKENGVENWGLGAVCSRDEKSTVKVLDLPASGEGDFTLTCFYKDIKKALEVTPDGILFNMWSQAGGKVVGTRVKVEAYDILTESIHATKKAVDEDAPTHNLSGQRVSKSYRGIVIKGGKKYIVK